MPASRSAWATTVMPTVWVSRPSLASSTRSGRTGAAPTPHTPVSWLSGGVHAEHFAHGITQLPVRGVHPHRGQTRRHQVGPGAGRRAHRLEGAATAALSRRARSALQSRHLLFLDAIVGAEDLDLALLPGQHQVVDPDPLAPPLLDVLVALVLLAAERALEIAGLDGRSAPPMPMILSISARAASSMRW